MNMDTIIETKNLTKKFGNFTANDHIDLAVKEGEIRAIIGENGAGKDVYKRQVHNIYFIDQRSRSQHFFRKKAEKLTGKTRCAAGGPYNAACAAN